jgi:hypothetical protein
MHGRGTDQCDLSWAAMVLARHGYVALNPTDTGGDLLRNVDAVRSGVRFLRSRRNPYRRQTDRKRIGLIGHSQGASAVSAAQEKAPGVKAVVALDLLARKLIVPGKVNRFIRPRVPALNEASDDAYPPGSPIRPEQKKGGYAHWRAAGKPTISVVLRDFGHGAFAHQGSAAQHRLISHYVVAWLDRWLRKRRSATRRLLAKRIRGTRTVDLLSVQFRSAAFLPGRIDCKDFAACLRRR